MSSATSIYWELKVNNILIDGAKRACINSIEFDELCDGSATCTLQITDPDFQFIEATFLLKKISIISKCIRIYKQGTFKLHVLYVIF